MTPMLVPIANQIRTIPTTYREETPMKASSIKTTPVSSQNGEICGISKKNKAQCLKEKALMENIRSMRKGVLALNRKHSTLT
jgi:hypothetical protein